MSKKVESEFLALVDEFGERMEKFFPSDGKHSKGVLVIAIDGDLSETTTGVRAIVRGKRDELIPGIVKVMNDSDAVLAVVKESSEYYEFVQNPKKAVASLLKKLLED